MIAEMQKGSDGSRDSIEYGDRTRIASPLSQAPGCHSLIQSACIATCAGVPGSHSWTTVTCAPNPSTALQLKARPV